MAAPQRLLADRARAALALLVLALAPVVGGCRWFGEPVSGSEAVSLIESSHAYRDLQATRAAAGRTTRLQAIDLLDGWWRIDAVDGRRDRVDVVAVWRVHRSDARIERRASDGGWTIVDR